MSAQTLPPREKGVIHRADGDIAYETMGAGPPLVFAHGLGGNLLSWWQQLPHFAQTHTCVTFSHRGFFPSTAPSNPTAFADDLLALADQLRLDRISIVAQSMGGWTAIEFALAHPDRLTRMVLASTSGAIDPRQAGVDPTALEAWQTKAAASHASGVHPAMGQRGAAEQPEMHYLYRAMDELSVGLDKEALRAGLGRSRTRPATDLAAIASPTLWLTGAEDLVFPSLVAPAMAAHMSNARHVSVPEAGHSAYFERPHAFNKIVADFLAETA